MYERNPCFHGLLFIYDNLHQLRMYLVLETHNIIIGVQDKNNSIKIRFCVIKIQKIDGQLSKVGNTNCRLPK